ncbi:hypothetical protein [Williamsia sp. CHRR-6]|uniref:hypothetical protein n=1 Tax=Williamsia sp. CHRR-6 TaxID=2835871 RepID=UPI001BDAE505|nr:hypothetical protein [Williamsia sp. CHRR-6]MBT0566425.1 hypothetical protein [Williamsia sp. CHRR-6]
MPNATFVEMALPAVRLAQKSVRVHTMGEVGPTVGPLFDEVNRLIDSAGLTRRGPGVAHYLDTGDGVIVAAGEQVDTTPPGLDEVVLPAVARAVTIEYEGAELSGIAAAWQSLVLQVQRLAATPTGPCREVYHTPGVDGRWRVELQQPVLD